MTASVIMPQLGETVAEGKIITWFKSVGDDVAEGDRLFEVETDKVTVDVEAVNKGRLTEIRVAGGETAKVGSIVAILGGEAVPAAAAPKTAVSARPAFEEVATPTENYGRAKAGNGVQFSPLARRMIAQKQLDFGAIARQAETKGLRRVSERDLAQLASTAREKPAAQAMTLTGIRKKTADRLAENWRTIPHVFQGIEVDFSEVERTRAAVKQPFQRAHGVTLTYLAFIGRAVALAMRDFPNINATFDGETLRPSAAINLGIAVDLDHAGLVVPVVKNAGDYTVEGLAKAIAALTEKARTGRLKADDLSGGTYSITNNGSFGTLFTAPIINAPQVAILSTDAIRKRPAVVSTAEGDFIAPRLTGILGQSFDHRAFDGAYAASFLSRLKQVIETHDWSAEITSR